MSNRSLLRQERKGASVEAIESTYNLKELNDMFFEWYKNNKRQKMDRLERGSVLLHLRKQF